MSGEAAFIAALRAFATHPAARGLADDCAVLEVGGETLVLTHDMMVEGVHWLPGQDPANVAWKLVATNLSDLAAKGAEPIGVLLGYSLGADDLRFIDGLREVLEAFSVPLLGGDSVGGGAVQAHGLTAIGRATHRPVPSRSGARAGDGLWLTGEIGAAMLGFDAVRGGLDEHVGARAFARPVPLLAEGRALAPLVTAMMDVSDGLLLDASRIAAASKVTLAVKTAAVPLAQGVEATGRADEALRWGDDYELLFTLPAGTEPPVPAHRIGDVVHAGQFPVLLDGAPPDPSQPLGYLHGSSR
ncbi:thiamine-phosphate kinase [Novosphingobium sp. Gsoil 351]|uniref:thiamine-phosphate kinase n=1 Tax=Novosphingobium sp. Gsoil 351 TaxID=2675225 RepID=UPI0012B4B315|nr:thiamine-phosphate kinase [Novosphingobium sp. Gsoil 351]QGN53260.1 thiamine-phosphate kinase [Novosphingobium sp. Gsoil 351]